MSHYINSTKVVYLLGLPTLNSLYFSHPILPHVAIYCFSGTMASHPRVSRVQVDTGFVYSRCMFKSSRARDLR